MSNLELRVLDCAKLYGSEEEQKEFAHDFLAGITEVGFLKLINHGLTEEDINMLLQQSKALFTLPREEKQKFANVVAPQPQRGWTAVGVETTATLNTPGNINLSKIDNTGLKDLKETFDMGRVDDPEYPNKYPAEDKAPGFKSWMNGYFARAQGLALDLMRSLEIAMDLAPNALVDRCQGNASELRMLYYPQVHRDDLKDGKSMRIWPHTDFGILTLLVQGSTGGLQIEDPPHSGTFTSVPLEEKSELLVNVGDTLERWSNGRVPAGLHRVTASDDDELEIIPERYSVAFLFKAGRETSAGPIPIFVPDGTTSKYEEMTALEYHRRRTAVMLY